MFVSSAFAGRGLRWSQIFRQDLWLARPLLISPRLLVSLPCTTPLTCPTRHITDRAPGWC